MIKLVNLLLEVSQHRMLIMAGGAGAGKTTLINKIKSKLPGVKILNPDEYIEDKNSPMYNSLTKASLHVDDIDVPNTISKGESFIWDTTSSSPSKILGGTYRNKQVKGFSNTPGYETMMIMVYTHPLISLLRNFKRERKLPRVGVISTWNSVYANIDAYKAKLGDNFILYQYPDVEYKKEIDAFNQAVTNGKLAEYFEQLSMDNDFQSSFKKDTSTLSPEDKIKQEKNREKSKQILDIQIQKLEKEFMNIENKVKDHVVTSENEVINKAVNFLK